MPRPLRERVSVGRVSGAFLFGAYAAPNPAPVFFLFVAMQSVLPPEGISIRYAYACPFNGGKQAKTSKERISAKKEKHALFTALLRSARQNGCR